MRQGHINQKSRFVIQSKAGIGKIRLMGEEIQQEMINGKTLIAQAIKEGKYHVPKARLLHIAKPPSTGKFILQHKGNGLGIEQD